MQIGIDIRRDKPVATIAIRDGVAVTFRDVEANYYTALPSLLNKAMADLDPSWPQTSYHQYIDKADREFLQQQGVCFCCLTQTCTCDCHGF